MVAYSKFAMKGYLHIKSYFISLGLQPKSTCDGGPDSKFEQRTAVSKTDRHL